MLTKIVEVLLSIQIGIISVIGDKLLENQNNAILRAVIDNSTHALVAGISWLLIVIISRNSIVYNIPNILLCTAISSLIDVDHFIEARSWKLDAAIHLERRPFLHCTTLPILLWLILFQISKINTLPKLENYSWIILISFLSHHIRDGTRRGLWFPPFGTTKPIPYYLYIAMDIILPYAVFLLMNQWTNKFSAYRENMSIV